MSKPQRGARSRLFIRNSGVRGGPHLSLRSRGPWHRVMGLGVILRAEVLPSWPPGSRTVSGGVETSGEDGGAAGPGSRVGGVMRGQVWGRSRTRRTRSPPSGRGSLGAHSSSPVEPRCLVSQLAPQRELPVAKEAFRSQKEFLDSVGVSVGLRHVFTIQTLT